jgi:hypothetical protein
MKILLHQCCGPCSFYPLETLIKSNFEVTTFFYNPNIHPYTEFIQRLDNAEKVNKLYNIKGYFFKFYNIKGYLKKLPSNNRCSYCYDLRIKITAAFAKKNNFHGFTTTLLYSKYQQHDVIKSIAIKYSSIYNIEFFYNDYRDGWQKGIDQAKLNNIYMQKYCGCIFSEQERYTKKIKKNKTLEYV